MDKKLLALLSWNYFSTYLAYSLFPPYFPKVAQDEKGVDQQTVGFIMWFWYVGYAIFAIFISHILRFTGRKNATVVGLLMLALDFLLAALCTKIEGKLLFVIAYSCIRFLHGVSQAFVQVTTYSIIATWFKDDIAKVVGIIEFSWGCGIALGPLIAEILFNIGGFVLPLYVFSFFMLILCTFTHFIMSDTVEGTDEHNSQVIQVTQDSVNVNDNSIDEYQKEKISIFALFKYKLFVFGVLSGFFNLTLYVLLEPILTDRLTTLGVKEESLGQYFCIQPFVYSLVSVFVDSMILKKIHKRVCLIIGFLIFTVGFLVTGPSDLLFFIEPSIPLISIGLALLGIGCSLSFVPIFPEMIESVIFDYDDRIEDLNNTVASIMNASYGSGALGQL